MIDGKTMAYINSFAKFKAIEEMVNLDEKAKSLTLVKKPINIKFNVKNGPKIQCQLNDGFRIVRYNDKSNIFIKFSSFDSFNSKINQKDKKIFPIKGHLIFYYYKFHFKVLFNYLNKYIFPKSEDLQDKTFAKNSLLIYTNFYLNTLLEIGNNDPIGLISASRILDAVIVFEVENLVTYAIKFVHGKIQVEKGKPENYTTKILFKDKENFRSILDLNENLFSSFGSGLIEIEGNQNILNNFVLIFNKVNLYLSEGRL